MLIVFRSESNRLHPLLLVSRSWGRIVLLVVVPLIVLMMVCNRKVERTVVAVEPSL